MTTFFAGFLNQRKSVLGILALDNGMSLYSWPCFPEDTATGSGSRLSFPIILVFVLLEVGTSIFCFALVLSFSTAVEVPAPSFKSSLSLVLPSLSRF